MHGVAKLEKRPFISEYSNNTDITLKRLEKHAISTNEGQNISALLKCHHLGDKTKDLIKTKKILNVYTIRDPRDCIASMEKFWPREEQETFAERLRHFQRMLIDGETFLQDDHSLIIRYEEMVKTPKIQIEKIAEYLRIKCDPPTLQSLTEATSVETSKTHIARIEKNKSTNERVYCGTTQLHERHINGGEVGRWRTDLHPKQQDATQIAFYPWLKTFEYI